MAIIIDAAGAAESERLDSIIAAASRPALMVRDDTFEPPDAWPLLREHRRAVERTLRGVGRLEMKGGVLPFAGTAFVVGRRLAVTANYVGEALLTRDRGGAGDTDVGNEGRVSDVRLEFYAEHGSERSLRIAVRRVHRIHPYWGVAFLELEEPVDQDRVLAMTPRLTEDWLVGRTICVIGYPAQDARLPEESVRRIFGDVFGVKRIMPGQIIGLRRQGQEDARMLCHDASTTGGVGGAPLVDIETGTVLGINFAGVYLEGNYAAPAWELRRDPQWGRIWRMDLVDTVKSPEEVSRQAIGAGRAFETRQIFSYDEIMAVHDDVVESGLADDETVSSLFAGLPPEFVASLPRRDTASAQLLERLHVMNRLVVNVGGHTPLYYVLSTAKRLRPVWDPEWVMRMDAYLEKARRVESELGPPH